MDHERIGLSLGTGYGCLKTMYDYYTRVAAKGPRFASSVLFPHSYANTPASLVSIEYRIMGPTNTVCTGSTSAAGAIGYAFDLLRHGRIDAMLAGGVDSLSRPLLEGLAAQGVLSPANGGEEAARPFDARRNGYVAGEGAGILLLERAECARRRGADALGRLVGYGLAQASAKAARVDPWPFGSVRGAVRHAASDRRPASDRDEQPVAHGLSEALAAAIRAALADAELEPADIDGVFASANGSRELDACEALALADVFGGPAAPVTSLKCTLGESIGASGGLSLIAALWAMRIGAMPPTRGFEHPDGEITVDVVAEPLRADLRTCLVSCADASGACGALVVAAP